MCEGQSNQTRVYNVSFIWVWAFIGGGRLLNVDHDEKNGHCVRTGWNIVGRIYVDVQ